MRKHYKITATLGVPLNVEFETSKHYTEKELQEKIKDKLKIEIGYILPNLEYLDSDIKNIKMAIIYDEDENNRTN